MKRRLFLFLVAAYAVVGTFVLDAHDAKPVSPAPSVPLATDLTPEMAACDRVVDAWRRDVGVDLLPVSVACVPKEWTADEWAGLAYPETILVAAGYDDGYTRQVLAHETGHEYEFAYLDDAARFEFMRLRGLTGEWRASGAQEDYADVFAYSLGEWKQTDGREWRTAGGRAPLESELDTMRSEGLIP